MYHPDLFQLGLQIAVNFSRLFKSGCRLLAQFGDNVCCYFSVASISFNDYIIETKSNNPLLTIEIVCDEWFL